MAGKCPGHAGPAGLAWMALCMSLCLAAPGQARADQDDQLPAPACPAHKAQADKGFVQQGFWLEPYEPTTLGATYDSDDVRFMDITLSVKYPVMPDLVCHLFSGREQLAIAFTTRFGFYWGTRESAPVVGKRFNPKILWRHTYDSDSLFKPRLSAGLLGEHAQSAPSYVEFAYAHESNGQSITTLQQFQAAEASYQQSDGHPEFAYDYISRGWDYLGFNWKQVLPWGNSASQTSTQLKLRYFLPHGMFQGEPEEVHDWEADPQGKPRRAVNGVALFAKYQRHTESNRPEAYFGDLKLAAQYETGYETMFRYSTVRVEAGIQFKQLPITLWWQDGYASDLALYFRKVRSWGIELDIGSF